MNVSRSAVRSVAVRQFSPLLMYFATLMQYTTQNVQRIHLNTQVSNMTKCRDLKRNTQDPKVQLMENGIRRRRGWAHKMEKVKQPRCTAVDVWALCDAPPRCAKVV